MLRLALLIGMSAWSMMAAVLPSGFTESLVASGISNATAMEFAPDGRLFVAQQTGQLRVIKNGALLSTPFITLPVDSVGERGLLGIAFDPNFTTNQFVYLYYTWNGSPRHNRVSRFTANGDVAVTGSESVIFELDDLSAATNHNGGAIHFRSDGTLLIGVGENANGTNAQSFSTVLGKILRINSDGSIPANNPFLGTTTGRNQAIWALGLRNPFTFTFQPGTGRMFINDVGENTWEEINDGIAGSNYGWPTTEGMTSNPSFRSPLFVYGHGSSATTGCAIAGGAFYNPPVTVFPSNYVGSYFFADLCSGWIRRFDPATGTSFNFASGVSSPVDLKVWQDGNLYYLARGSNSVFKVTYGSVAAPSGLTATAVSTSQINLSWTDNSSNEDGFAIERSTDGTTFAPFGTAPANATTFSATGLNPGTLYYFRVTATNSALGNSAPSNVASATTNSAGGVPTLSSMTPSTGTPGAVVNVTLKGTNFAAPVTVNFSVGAAVSNVVLVDAQTITATFTIKPQADFGPRTVKVTAAGGTSNSLTFTVVAGTPAPTLTSVSPASGSQGTTVPVTLTGTDFTAGASVAITGAGVTISNVTVVNATRITANFSIAAAAATGARSVTVTTSNGTSNAQSFTVNTAGPALPTLSSMTPSTGAPGATVNVTLKGTNFTSPFSVNFSVGATVTNVVLVDPQTITATFTMKPQADFGPRTVSVTTSAGVSNKLTFTVQ